MESKTSTIQHDIVELEQLLEQKRSALERQKTTSSEGNKPEKEIVREVVGEKIQQQLPAYVPSLPSSSAPVPLSTDTPSYLDPELADKVKSLVDIVFSKNLEEGIREAAKTANPALIDAFHDMLTDELYGKLIENRKLDKVE